MTGRVVVRNGFWSIVISYKDQHGQFRQHWKKTELKERGNKKEAERLLNEEMASFALERMEEEQKEFTTKKLSSREEAEKARQMLFEEYLEHYVQDLIPNLAIGTQLSYKNIARVVRNFFEPKKIKLIDLTPEDILAFYDFLRKEHGVKEITIKRYANVIRPALKKAYIEKVIPENPHDFVPTIHKAKNIPTYFNKEEMAIFFEAIKGHELELEFKMLAFYGLRRSELLGLKWDSVDFNNKILYIRRTLQSPKGILTISDKMKTATSNRSLPLVPEIIKMLRARQERIQKDKDYHGASYIREFDGFVCVNKYGGMTLPEYLTKSFKMLIEKAGLKPIRLHDLRHSCASLMISNGVQMKQVQEWLGHANFQTTADVYSHLDFSSKQESAKTIAGLLDFSGEQEKEPEMTAEEIEQEIKRLKQLLAKKKK